MTAARPEKKYDIFFFSLRIIIITTAYIDSTASQPHLHDSSLGTTNHAPPLVQRHEGGVRPEIGGFFLSKKKNLSSPLLVADGGWGFVVAVAVAIVVVVHMIVVEDQGS